jgi:phage-related protein
MAGDVRNGSVHRGVASIDCHTCPESETIAVLRPVVFHVRAKEEIRALPRDVRLKLGSALLALQRGFNLGLPLSRPMSVVMPGVEELRLRGESGQYRVFCFRKAGAGILVARVFHKKSRETPLSEIALARRRLMEMLHELAQDPGRT